MTKTYIQFFYPGSFVSETSDHEVPSREHKLPLPPKAYGFRFFDREEIEQDGETLKGKAKNYSPMYYVGEEFSAEAAMSAPWANRILKSNIENNGYKRVVRTKFGQVMPLDDKDVVIK